MSIPNMLAVDVGYSFVKAIDGNDQYYDFPSMVMNWVDDGVSVETSHPVLTWQGHEMKVGTLEEGGRPHATSDFHGSFQWQCLLCWAFALFCQNYGVQQAHIGKLAVGLPYFQFKEDIVKKLGEVKDFRFKVDGRDYQVQVDRIVIFPQGASIVSDHSDGGDVGIIDIGFHTLDMVLVKEGRISETKSASRIEGVRSIFQGVDRTLNARFGRSGVDYDRIFKILKDKNVRFRGELHDLSGEIDPLIDSYASKIESIVEDLWGNDVDFLDTILVAGGGAILLKNRFTGRYKVVEQSRFANAQGFLSYLRQQQ